MMAQEKQIFTCAFVYNPFLLPTDSTDSHRQHYGYLRMRYMIIENQRPRRALHEQHDLALYVVYVPTAMSLNVCSLDGVSARIANWQIT